MRTGWMALVCLAGCAVDGLGGIEQTVDEPISAIVYKYGGDETGSPAVEANVRVDFIAPDDSVQTVYSDANGIAAAVSPAGTRMAVYQTTIDHRPIVRVFYATRPGDEIVVGKWPRNAYPTLGTITFAIPKRTPNAIYKLTVSCSGNWAPAGNIQDVSVYPCEQATNATAVAWAFDANTGELLSGPSVKRGLDLTQLVGTTVHMPGYARQPSTVTGTFLGVPTDAWVSWGTAYFFDDDPTVFSGVTSSYVNPTVESLPIEAVGNRTLMSAQYELANQSYVGHTLIENQRIDSYTFEASNTVRSIGDGTYDFATRTFHWTEGPGRAATLVRLHATVNPYPARDWQFELYAPADTTSLTLPELPPDLTPAAGNQVTGFMYAYEVPGQEYDALLEQASSLGVLAPDRWPGFTGSVWFASGNLQAR